MGYFAGLDVSLEETTICIVDDAGMIVREARAASEPEVLVAFFEACGMKMERVGLEACSLTAWLHGGLTEAAYRRSASRHARPRRRWARCRTRRTATTRAGSLRYAHRLVSRGAREEPVLPRLARAADSEADGPQQAPRCRERYTGPATRGRAEGRHAKPQRLPARVRELAADDPVLMSLAGHCCLSSR